MTSAAKSPIKSPDTDQAYISLVALMFAHTQTTIRLDEMQIIADRALLTTTEVMRDEHATLQGREAALKQQIEIIVRQHPEWFAERKSIVTPGGTVKMTSTTTLEVDNEELSVTLVESHLADGFECEAYLRRKTELNLDALAALDDAELRRYKIRRVQSDKFSVAPAKVKLGKPAAKAAEVAK